MVSLRKPTMLAAGLAVAGLVLTGCAGGSGNPGETGGAETPEASGLEGTGWRVADYDEVQDGGTLTIPIDTFPANWNLNNLDAGTVDDQLIANLHTAAYVIIAEDGSWEPNPDYAESLELTSEDPQVVELRINPDAVWSDGTPMTVADIQANWNALNGTNTDFAPIATNVWEDIESVEQGDDERHAVITFANTNADWPSIFGNIYPQWLYETPESFNEAWATGPYAPDGETYVSGGPFVVSDLDANAGVATFEPNENWWGQTPKLERVIFQVVSRDGLATAFANREIDVFNLYGSADNYETAQGREDAEIQRSLGTTYRHVTLNGTSEVFSDVQVRRAFAMSLNREVLAQAILSPVGNPVEVLNNLIYLPGQNGYEDHGSDVIGYDVEGAKSVLEEAGAEFDGNGMASIDGQPLEVRFVIPSDNPNSANIATLVQQQTAEAGFAVEIDTVPSDDFFTDYITTETRDFDATYFAWQGTAFPVSSTQSIFYPADSGQNYAGVTDESLGEDWIAANSELDPEARIELANQIDQKLINLVTTVPLFSEPYAWGVVETLANYGPTQFESVDWTAVGFVE